MTNNQDARPFVDLKKDAEEFREKFDEDIQECINYLDSKITALMCDPDSLGYSVRNVQQNALVEFSKAKYDIFVGVKSLITEKELEWINYMSEMKKLFIENVEIFLAGTKLEVKLPSSEFESSPGPRKSPGNRKANTSVTSSIYPIVNKITKKIPVLNPPRSKETQMKEVSNAGDNVQSNSNSRFSIRVNKPSGNVSLIYHEDIPDTSEDSEDEARPDRNRFQSRTGRSSTSTMKLASRNMQNEDFEMDTDEPEVELNTSRSVSNGTIRRSTKMNSSELNSSLSSSRRRSNSKTEINIDKSPARGRQSKQIAQNSKLELELISTQPEESAEAIVNSSLNSKKPSGRPKKNVVNSSLNSKKPSGRPKQSARLQNISSSSEETEDEKEMETEISQRTSCRGRQTTKKNNKVLEKETTENTDTVVEEESSEKTMNIKTRRGRAATSKNSDYSISVKNTAPQTQSVRGRRRAAVVEEIIPEPVVLTPIARPAKSAARRKTMLPNFEDPSGSDIIPANPTRARSKRKTVYGVAEIESAAPSKRLKVSSKKGITPAQGEDDEADDNLLESGENYSEWMALKSIDGKIPAGPAIYEVKVWRAKKPAYIGSCDNLRQKLTLYKLKQNSGHKHLDKFVDRNYDDIHIRYENVVSVESAKQDVKDRIKSFVAQFKTTPAYN